MSVKKWGTELARTELARRQRAELRFRYGNKLSDLNLRKLRSKQSNGPASALPGQKRLTASTPAQAPNKTDASAATDDRLPQVRCIASSYAGVRDVGVLTTPTLFEDTEQDVKEERAEVLIKSETMPQAPSPAPLSPSLILKQQSVQSSPDEEKSKPASRSLYVPVVENRATERWQQLAATVPALFRARRRRFKCMDERQRERRELFDAFTSSFCRGRA
ncbi:uncharacterized protein LOC115627334 [Scaptodrosophila lebanonensis]|uniref:Uncharacterized protein LOC115627334 n=1 Tax=Drosophila lebanonensis TaxID=7225 RepID=A0A6J2TS04_DROLE|nr:uncharacterized protein LOC115627334 [Scaptodrosophila lebanonensis]